MKSVQTRWSYTIDVATDGKPDQVAQRVASQVVDALREHRLKTP